MASPQMCPSASTIFSRDALNAGRIDDSVAVMTAMSERR